MPLIKSSSKKAFSKNVAQEMDSGKPQNQALAIAYNMKRKSPKKKTADGGMAEKDARPLQIERITDQEQPQRRLIIEPVKDDEMKDAESTVDAIMQKRMKKAYGGMAENTNEPAVPKRKADDDRLSEHEYMSDQMSEARIPRDSMDDQSLPEDEYDSEYATGRKPYAYGGAAEDTNEPSVPKRKPDDKRLPEDEYMSEQWSKGSAPARKPDDMRLPQDEYMDDQFDDADSVYSEPMSMAEEIMERRKFSEGGAVDLDENATEEPNNEDQMSFEALKKENYSEADALDEDQPMDSNEHGRILSDADSNDKADQMRSKVDYESHDEPNAYSMVEQIQRRMKAKRKF